MKTMATMTLFAVAIAVLVVVFAPVAQSQFVPVSEKTFEGQLTKLDSAMKTITVKGMEDKEIKEMTFKYSDDTLVVGGDRTVQGLSGKPEATLKISYRVDRGSNEATRIEVTEKEN